MHNAAMLSTIELYFPFGIIFLRSLMTINKGNVCPLRDFGLPTR